MQNMSCKQKLYVAWTMVYFLLNVSKTTDKNLPLGETTSYLEDLFNLLQSAITEMKL